MTENSNEGKSVSTKLSPRREKNLEHALKNETHKIINVVEIIANEKVTSLMSRMDMCICSKCTCDVLALALNMLPTKYVTTVAGKQYIQLNSYKKQFETDVDIALMKACMVVKSAPNHDDDLTGEATL
jgi:Late competence development protein ComFB.